METRQGVFRLVARERWGALCRFFFVMFFASSAFAIGGLSPDGAKELDEVKRRMEPKPYVPSNAPGCARWKGRGFLGSASRSSLCVSGCTAVATAPGRFVVSGEACSARAVRPVAVERVRVHVDNPAPVADACGPLAGRSETSSVELCVGGCLVARMPPASNGDRRGVFTGVSCAR